MAQLYDRQFFDWVRLTALRSAERVLPVVCEVVKPTSVVDVGCGEGAWLSVWAALGVRDVAGIDGDYVERTSLMIEPGRFTAADLAAPFAAPRRFDLAQSLEVAEHLPPAAARDFIASLCGLSHVILFSAAQPGQGGENHINERRASYWAGLFAAQGYAAFDCIRPGLAGASDVAPWYRFNTILYANAAGQGRLGGVAAGTQVDTLTDLDRAGDLGWRIRRALLRPLPVPVVSWLSRARYQAACARERRAATSKVRAARA